MPPSAKHANVNITATVDFLDEPRFKDTHLLVSGHQSKNRLMIKYAAWYPRRKFERTPRRAVCNGAISDLNFVGEVLLATRYDKKSVMDVNNVKEEEEIVNIHRINIGLRRGREKNCGCHDQAKKESAYHAG